MKKIKIKLKTKEEVIKEGWREKGDRLYFSESKSGRYRRGDKIVSREITKELGKTIDVVGYKDGYYDQYFEVLSDGYHVQVPFSFVSGNLPKAKEVMKQQVQKLFGDKKSVYYPALKKLFFDCDFSEMKLSEAKKVARWILTLGEK